MNEIVVFLLLSLRVELKTSRLLNGCSNQLSYESLVVAFIEQLILQQIFHRLTLRWQIDSDATGARSASGSHGRGAMVSCVVSVGGELLLNSSSHHTPCFSSSSTAIHMQLPPWH